MYQQLNVEQHQSLFLTTEVQQGISLLNMNALELGDYLRNCVEENPFLQLDHLEHCKHSSIPDKRESMLSSEVLLSSSERRYETREHSSGAPRDDQVFERYTMCAESLEEHLESQLSFDLKTPAEKAAAHYLMGNIDKNGYLCIGEDEAALQLGVPVDFVERIIGMIQKCNPVGIGARSVQECLTLQLEDSCCGDDLAQQIIDGYLDELGAGRIKFIARCLGTDESKVQEAFDLIRTFNPHPGIIFNSSRESVIWPEVSIKKKQSGYKVCMENLDIPLLALDEDYVAFLDAETFDKKTDNYLNDWYHAALGLIGGVQQRRLTMYRIACCLVDMQKDFLEKGIAYLKPLTMVEVADRIQVHESTVSRVVNGNYMQTPRGLFEMKYFFSSGIAQCSQEAFSSRGIKERIKELIDSEDPSEPLSDAALVDKLGKEGIVISRRTVNKYRQSMEIPPQMRRRRYCS